MDFIIIIPLRSEFYFENIKLGGGPGVEVEHLRGIAQLFFSSDLNFSLQNSVTPQVLNDIRTAIVHNRPS